MTSEKSDYPMFDGKDFADWKFRLELTLAERELLDHVRKEPKVEELLKDSWVKVDVKAKNVIVKSLGREHSHIVRAEKSAHGMLKALSEIYERSGAVQERHLRMKLSRTKCEEGQPLDAHFAAFDSIVLDLRATGAAMTETEQVTHLLMSLPRSYEHFVTVLLAMEDLTLRKAKARLLNEEIRRSEMNEEESTGRAAFLGAPKKFAGKCWRCNEPGHRAFECPKAGGDESRSTEKRKPPPQKKAFNLNRKEDDRGQEENTSRAFAFVAAQEIASPGSSRHGSREILWIIDSGCTDHMTNDDTLFLVERQLSAVYPVSLAEKGQAIEATKIGFIASTSVVNGREYDCDISDVLFAPGLRHNLLSVSRLEKAGFAAVFREGGVELWAGDVLFAEGRRRNDLYELKLMMKERQLNVAAAVDTNALWHRRLGHIGMRSIKHMVKNSMVTGIKPNITDTLGVCEPCVMGKHSRATFHRNERRASRPLELVHTDVCGPITPTTWDGKRYFVTFIDDYTHFTIAYLISTKDEVYECLKEYYSMVCAGFGSSVARMRCDNGGEYISRRCKEFCKEKGVVLEYTAAYTPEQNGRAERMNRTLVEKARSLIYESQLPKEMWGEAIMTALYLTNRSCTAALDDLTPTELWYGKKPDLSNLRVFGCRAYAHLPKCKRRKMDAKSEKLIMIGYSGNGYRLWNPAARKVVLSRDVIFDEAVLPGEETEPEHDPQSEHIVGEPVPEEIAGEPEQAGEQEVEGDVRNADESDAVESDAVESDAAESSADGSDTGESDSDESGADVRGGAVRGGAVRGAAVREAAVRKSERVKKRPVWHKDYQIDSTALLTNGMEDVPESYNAIEGRGDAADWHAAVRDELNSLTENQTWDIVDLPRGAKVITSKWVFKKKVDKNGDIERLKARLVARGFQQTAGVDYHDTFAPVAKLSTVRFLLAVGIQWSFEFWHMDVTTAFLYGKLDETIFMKPPPGLDVEEGKVCELKRSLYGLKQSPKCWNNRLHAFLSSLNFQRSDADYCLYVRNTPADRLYVLLYVDDLLICGNNSNQIAYLKESLSAEFRMKDLGRLEYFMGMRIRIDDAAGVVTVDQTAFAERILERFGMDACNAVATPLEPGVKFGSAESSDEVRTNFRQLIGSLMYLMLGTRPDLCFAINLFSRYQDKATFEHWNNVKRVLRYIKGTTGMHLVYKRKDEAVPLVGYVDSDWANDPDDRRSTSGYLFEVYGNLISWTTKKQGLVTLSTAEAEYVAASQAVCDAIWFKKLFQDVGLPIDHPIPIYEDNQACIFISKNPESKRTKHVEVKYHYVREKVWTKEVELLYISTKDQKADILTKPLARLAFEKMRMELGMERGGV